MSFLNEKVPKHSKGFAQVVAPLRKDARALNERLLEPDAFTRATAEGWRQYQQQTSDSKPKTTGVDCDC